MNSRALVDVTAKGAPVYTKFQFERQGYFCVDKDSTKDKVNISSFKVCHSHPTPSSLSLRLS